MTESDIERYSRIRREMGGEPDDKGMPAPTAAALLVNEELASLTRQRDATQNPTLRKVYDDMIAAKTPKAAVEPRMSTREKAILRARANVEHYSKTAPGGLTHKSAIARLNELTVPPAIAAPENPFLRERFSLTQCATLVRDWPDLAHSLREAAIAVGRLAKNAPDVA